jgi:hypothetical protein
MLDRARAAVEASVTILATLQSTGTIDTSLLRKLLELMAEQQKTMNLLVEILAEKRSTLQIPELTLI